MLKIISSKFLLFVIVLVAIAGIVLVYKNTKKIPSTINTYNTYRSGNQSQQSAETRPSPIPTITKQNADQALLKTQTDIQTTMDKMNSDLNNLDTYSNQANNNEGF